MSNTRENSRDRPIDASYLQPNTSGVVYHTVAGQNQSHYNHNNSSIGNAIHLETSYQFNNQNNLSQDYPQQIGTNPHTSFTGMSNRKH